MRASLRRVALVTLSFLVALSPYLFMLDTAQATTLTATLRPDGDIAVNWAAGGTADTSCSGNFCKRVDEATANDNDYLEANNAAQQAEMSLSNIPATQRVTSITVKARVIEQTTGRQCTLLLFCTNNGNDQLVLGAKIGAAVVGSNQTYNPSTGYTTASATYNGSWSKQQIDDLRVYLGKADAVDYHDTLRVSMVWVEVSYITPAQLSQNGYRLYANANSVNPGASLASKNTAADIAQSGNFRLRLGVTPNDEWVTGTTWVPHMNQYVLQYARRNPTATCVSLSSGWADVTSSTAVRWNVNSGAANGAPISTLAGGESTGVPNPVPQYYQSANTFSLRQQVNAGQTAVWDFSLATNSTTSPGNYCLRIVKSDGTLLDGYTSYAEVAITKDYSVDVVNASGTEVVSPLVAFPMTPVSTVDCAISPATLGTASQKIRINNDLVTNGWNITMAATGGSSSVWSSGSQSYDYNDPSGPEPGCGDGPDADGYAGQLRVNPATAVTTPKPGCSNTGISKGVNAAFSQGTTDAITLVAASPAASRFCYWDVTGITLEQRIPAQTPAGSYSLDMTITMTAL